jgi:endonuclease YncB( thermonuclease family)
MWAALSFAEGDSNQIEGKVFTLRKVIDGRTIELESGEVVRLIGIEVPSEPDVEAARGFLARSLKDQRFRLELDEANEPAGHRDGEGRFLAYVFIDTEIPDTRDVSAEEYYEHFPRNPRNGFYSVMINASSVKSGFAAVDTEFPFKYKDLFSTLERQARARLRGIWKSGPP